MSHRTDSQPTNGRPANETQCDGLPGSQGVRERTPLGQSGKSDVPASTFMESERLWFRGPEAADAAWFTAVRNDPLVRPWMTYYFPMAQDTARQSLETQNPWEHGKANDHSAFVFGLRGTAEPIGIAALFAIDWTNRLAEFGIQIGPPHWSQGYGREVARRMLQYAFDELNLNRVELRARGSNLRGIKAYEAAGFVHEGTKRQTTFFNGCWEDDVLMGVLRSEWVGRREISAASSGTAPLTS